MSKRALLLLLALLASMSCAPRSGGADTDPTSARDILQAAAGVRSLKPVGPAESYSPDTLFEYVNGAARGYISYGFAELAHLVIADESQGELTVDVFDMGSLLGAYGYFSSGRPEERSPREWGVEGYVAERRALTWKSKFFIQVEADQDDPELLARAEALVSRLVSQIPGEAESPAQLAYLPEAGLVPGSDSYVGASLMGYEFLPGGFLARYSMGEEECVLFFSELPSDALATAAIEKLAEHGREWGQQVESGSGLGGESIWIEEPGIDLGLAAQQGRFVAGVWHVPGRAEAKELMAALLRRLPAS